MTETMTQEPQVSKACGYSRCGNEVTYSGKGRPPEYCTPGGSARRWPELGGKTCKQLAAEERAAAQRSGLAEVMEAYASTQDPVLEAISVLGRVLAERAEQGQAVLQAVDGRVAEAEQTAAEALARAAEAETARESAVRQAVADRKAREEAQEARRVAERMARDAEEEKEQQVRAAWTTTVEAEARAAAAEEAAAGARSSAAHARQEVEAERARSARLADELAELRTEHKAAVKELRELSAVAAARQAQAEAAERRTGELEARVAALYGELAAAKAETAAARAEAEAAERRAAEAVQVVQAERARAQAADDIERRVRDAYWQVARQPQDWVELSRIRSLLEDLDRAAVDEALRRMERTPYVHLVPEADQKRLTEAERAAAVSIGGVPKHLLAIER